MDCTSKRSLAPTMFNENLIKHAVYRSVSVLPVVGFRLLNLRDRSPDSGFVGGVVRRGWPVVHQ